MTATTSDRVFHKEGEIMSSTSYSSPSIRGQEFWVSLLFGALFPFFLAAALILRAIPSSSRSSAHGKSIVREARENLSIAISYALMARAMLQSFARD